MKTQRSLGDRKTTLSLLYGIAFAFFYVKISQSAFINHESIWGLQYTVQR